MFCVCLVTQILVNSRFAEKVKYSYFFQRLDNNLYYAYVHSIFKRKITILGSVFSWIADSHAFTWFIKFGPDAFVGFGRHGGIM